MLWLSVPPSDAGGLQRAAQLMAALQQQQSVPSLALRVLALGVLQEAGRGEAAGEQAGRHPAAGAWALRLDTSDLY
jgi:hypothetical protein